MLPSCSHVDVNVTVPLQSTPTLMTSSDGKHDRYRSRSPPHSGTQCGRRRAPRDALHDRIGVTWFCPVDTVILIGCILILRRHDAGPLMLGPSKPRARVTSLFSNIASSLLMVRGAFFTRREKCVFSSASANLRASSTVINWSFITPSAARVFLPSVPKSWPSAFFPQARCCASRGR